MDDDAASDFDAMFAEARAGALRWARKVRAEVRQEEAALERDRAEFQDEMVRLRRELLEQREVERERIRDDRRLAKIELERASQGAREERLRAPETMREARWWHGMEHGREAWRSRLEREQHRKRVEAHRREVQKVAEHNAAAEAVVELNIGGTVFATPRHTLAQQPGSLFSQWLLGQASAPVDRTGRICLDRDSSLFRIILNFLRNPEAPPPTRDLTESEALCKEAGSYGIRFFPFPLVYALGGHDGAGHLSSVELLDVENRCWRSSRDMLSQRAHFGATALGSRLQLFGGRNSEYQALCDTECLDCLRGEWMGGANLVTPRRNCAGAQDGSRAFAVGGFDGEQLLDSVEALDLRMKKWQQLRPMASPRSSACAAVLEGRLWVMGGTTGAERLRSVEAFDLRAGRWDRAPAAMCEARSSAQACACLGQLYAMGGIDEQHRVRMSAENLGKAPAGTWTMLRSMQQPRMDFGCCGLGDMIMVAGGLHGEPLSSSEFYKPEIDDWQLGPRMLSPRYGHQLVLMNL